MAKIRTVCALSTMMNKSQWLLVSRSQLPGDPHPKPRSKTTMRSQYQAEPLSSYNINRDDSLTDFLKENAVTSLPPIDLINRFRFSGVEQPLKKGYFRKEVERREKPIGVRYNVLTKRYPLRLGLKELLGTEILVRKSASPDTVKSVTRSALKPLSKAQLEGGTHRNLYARDTLLPSFIPHSLDPIVTVRSHLQHY